MQSFDIEPIVAARRIFNTKGKSLRQVLKDGDDERLYNTLNSYVNRGKPVPASFFVEIFRIAPLFKDLLDQEQAKFAVGNISTPDTPDKMVKEIAKNLLQQMDMGALIERIDSMKQQIEDLKSRIEQINKD